MAGLIVARTGIYRGLGLELSPGAGYLGSALAEITMLDICLLEKNRDTIKQAQSHIARNHMGERIKVIKGSMCEIPLAEGFIDLVTSRKSVFGWNNRRKIFQEVYRVLAPGGVACFCGGFEPCDVRFQINARLAEINPKLVGQLRDQVHWNHLRNFEKVLEGAGIASFDIKWFDNVMWIVFGKPSAKSVSRGPLQSTSPGPPRESQYHEATSL
jgi:ubiquinone/menaquinone biosynthesis C-methylase UbiE